MQRDHAGDQMVSLQLHRVDARLQFQHAARMFLAPFSHDYQARIEHALHHVRHLPQTAFDFRPFLAIALHGSTLLPENL